MPYNLYSTAVVTPKHVSIFKSKSRLASARKKTDPQSTSKNISLAESQSVVKMRKTNLSKPER
jgi:hypothetical protein